jgi:hypothetical protein
MSCGCKGGDNAANSKSTPLDRLNLRGKIFNYSLRTVLFLVASVFTPLLVPVIIYVLFKQIVLNKEIDFYPMLEKTMRIVLNKRRRKTEIEEEDDDIDLDNVNPDEYVTMDVETIK